MKIYYGAETKKALANFPFDFYSVHNEFILALIQVKKAAVLANLKTGKISSARARLILRACDSLLKKNYSNQFQISALQGGAGTSINMNVNEVIAGLAKEFGLGKLPIDPLDHVNLSQSTNDVNPSALRICVLGFMRELLVAVGDLKQAMSKQAESFKNICKLGRTHLQDAVPTTLGAEFSAYADILGRHEQKILALKNSMLELNLGGTAIGNGINADKFFFKQIYIELNRITGHKFKPAKNLMSSTSSHADFLTLSQAITALMLDCSKIASDLRLLSSGPKGGLSEINLVELQNGSSIMPGKNNPVLPEAVSQAYFFVSGNNLSIELANHAGQLELNVMLPVIVQKLPESLKIATSVLKIFSSKCVKFISANESKCRELLENSTAYASLLTPRLGYQRVKLLVKEALARKLSLKETVLKNKLLTPLEFDSLVNKSNLKFGR